MTDYDLPLFKRESATDFPCKSLFALMEFCRDMLFNKFGNRGAVFFPSTVLFLLVEAPSIGEEGPAMPAKTSDLC